MYYFLGIVGVLIVFNVAVYEIFVSNAFDTIKYGSPDTVQNEAREVAIIEQAEDRLESILYLVDVLILILVPFLSYALAGKTLQPIEKIHQQQKKFLADAAHELRTPLAVMKTGAEAVLTGPGTGAEYEKLLRESLEEIEQMSTMVNDLLFLARHDSERPKLLVPLDLSVVVLSRLEFMRPYAEKREILLKHSIQGAHRLLGDMTSLRRLVVNLIQNAIEHNRPGGTVSVSLRENDGRVEFEVSDTGIGIAAEHLPHIFDRFYKADPARTRLAAEKMGAGLGLSIVREIAEFHGATVDLRSVPDTGTTVTVVFPRAS